VVTGAVAYVRRFAESHFDALVRLLCQTVRRPQNVHGAGLI
jgi:hypothetical protein